MQFLHIVVISVVAGCSCAVLLKQYTDCGGHGSIHSISLEPCDKEPCHITRGNTYYTNINFTAQEHSKNLTNICHGIIAGVPENFQVSPSSACGNGVSCPLTPGQSAVYKASVTCPSDAPQVRLAAKWEVRDDRGKNLICIVFPLTID
ncbi:NPC intracellular cholesterol transporter 2-like [Mercenaria mercenaria]|uniref:NPC intracellular cholesterol transporter 2-like n=1 Tax=Mercenaria mercenaria TaxID=6596 RepID=UPI00234F0028|nr:NPC intracellular cholesterol transporter 2-like [Mercenaria mercenaria]